ncbi:probable RNA-binding protein EIF1AD isoform X2 [Rhodamnia argentea]|uniref:Probable RNA-binding protein EIF1AD isoform X2 n=1 Tax=Rhodamnia argentea TaxID=178133 RepID=A0A8B8PJP3_9MYRT|nr:probable RNA-binding protein EIF1AD isoform X2 [Rhodamnia argentea]
MKGGRKNLQWAAKEREVTLQDGQSIVQAVSHRGSNLVEVMDAQGNKLLALIPAKIQKKYWIGRGTFVVVDDSGKEKALESGSKVGCLVSRVLFYEQVRELKKSPDWPEAFKSSMDSSSEKVLALDNSCIHKKDPNSNDGDNDNDDKDDDEEDDIG